MFSTPEIRFVQTELRDNGHRTGSADGKLGPRTEKALRSALTRRDDELPSAWRDWPRTRLFTGYVQLRCRDEGVDPGPADGYWGTQTEYAVETLRQRIQNNVVAPPFRDSDELMPTRADTWPRQAQAQMRAFYGRVGQHQTRIQLPYEHRLAWDRSQRIHSYLCHEKVHDSLLRILTRVLDHYGEERIRELRLDLFGGCFNKRKKKGGTTWSMHAWGAAVDYDPEHNRFRWGWERAAFARPEYEAWWRIWEAEGWIGLGRKRNFDWMHIQAAGL
jgi:hypothetical protein